MLKPDHIFRDENQIPLDEIALVGRSNVGKSSLINHLLRHKNLARTSSAPGKTTTLNFYKVDKQLILVDLPGYGYAARSQEEQLHWSEKIDDYFNQCTSLKLILLLVDSRREFSENDLQMMRWALEAQKPLVLIFTKSDTLKPHEREAVKKRAQTIPALCYSIKDGKSRDSLISTINHLLKK